MADLTYLNDPAVLHNLKQRYYAKLIYVSARDAMLLMFFFSFLSPALLPPLHCPPFRPNCEYRRSRSRKTNCNK